MNDPTAQMSFQVGKSAVMAGQDYMEQNVCLPARQDSRESGLADPGCVETVQQIRERLSIEALL